MKVYKFLGSFAITLCLVLFSAFFVGCKPTLESIYIVSDSIAETVEINEEFLYPNLKVMAKYSDKSEVELKIEDLKITNISTTKLGEQTFKVEYQGKVATKKIVVTKNIKSISVESGISDKAYRYEKLNTSNAVIKITYSDNSTQNIAYSLTSGIVFGEIDTSVAGNKTLDVSYGGKSTTFSYTVIDITSIEYVSGLASEIYIDDVINKNDFVVKIVFADGETKNKAYSLNSGISIEGIDTSSAGDKTLVIKYKDIPSISKNYTVIEDAVVSAKIKEGSVKNSVVANTVLDTSNLTLTLTYASGKTKDVKTGFSVASFDTSIVGEYDLVVTYESLEPIKMKITVTNDFIITSFEKPQFVGLYESNSKTKNTFVKTGQTGVKGFEITENIYVVGNENDFIFRPTMGIYKNGSSQEISKFKTKIKVYVLNSSENFEELTDNLTDYVKTDDFEQTYKFTNLAENKIFKISVRPYFVSVEEEDLVDNCEFVFKVVNGYNVYNVQDLSLFDNANVDSKWTQYKQDNNIDLNKKISSLILQNDISVTKQDIPAMHFYTKNEVSGDIDAARAEGSLKDSDRGSVGFIYQRNLNKNQIFNFEGNYFKISAESMPLIVREFGEVSESEDATITTHTTLFGIFGAEETEKSSFNFNNISFVGNSKKSENAAKSGGIICFKTRNSNCTYYNCLSQGWFINTYFEYTQDATTMIKNSNVFDANNTLLYCFGASDVQIIDSHMIGAGGPVMICDHIDHDSSGNGGIITNVVTKNSVLESYVAGTENWFVAYKGVTLAGSIKAMDAFFSPYGKTILDSSKQKFNLLTVNKSGKTQGISSAKIKGTFKDETKDENDQLIYETGLDLSESSVAQMKNNILEGMAKSGMDQKAIESACEKMAILQTANNTIGVPGDTGWIVEPDATKFAQAKGYIFAYLFNNMGVTVGLSNLA